ncbi:MAG: response regulator [Dehalococcoidia bacterium]|nr:response regulator [Dehalococcoidia bacterium]
MVDVNMPNLNGLKTLEVMSQKGINAPAILLTSRESAGNNEKGLLLGAFDYIRKPINKKVLLMRMGSILAVPANQTFLNASSDVANGLN